MKKINKEDWSYKCPKCGSEDIGFLDFDYDLNPDDGWLLANYACNKCRQLFHMEYDVIYLGIQYDDTLKEGRHRRRRVVLF